MLASVVGQDLEEDEDGVFRIARRVAEGPDHLDRRSGRAPRAQDLSARGFDGYKGHVAVDPDSELILATTVTAGNAGDASAAAELLADDLASDVEPDAEGPAAEQQDERSGVSERGPSERLSVYGDSAYGSGELLSKFEQANAEVNCKVQPPVAPGGRFAKDAFHVDLRCRHGHLSRWSHRDAEAGR